MIAPVSLLFLLAAPVPADAAAHVVVRTRKCMGTECEFKAFAADEALVDRAFARGFAEFDRLEALITNWRPTSEVSRINDAAGKKAIKVSPDTLAVLEKAAWASALTDGAFDITVGVYKGLWKFDEDQRRHPARRQGGGGARASWSRGRTSSSTSGRDGDAATARAGHQPGRHRQGLRRGRRREGHPRRRATRLHRPGRRRHVRGRAQGRATVAGGHPAIPRGPAAQIVFALPRRPNQAFSTSGDYERFIVKDGVRYHHILDARTGFPARGTRSVTLLAPDAFTADALDTALFAVGAERAMKIVAGIPGLQAVIVDDKNRVHVTPGLKDKLVKHGDPTDGL